MSLKDQLDVEGVDTTIGFTQDVGRPASKDAVIVRVLKEAGCVPFCKTNVPQTMLALSVGSLVATLPGCSADGDILVCSECGNPLFGPTTNAYSKARTSGGSSGGEATLLASDASPLGIGSDIGGSLREPLIPAPKWFQKLTHTSTSGIPAHYSGCYGLKGSPGRFPSTGAKNPNPGFESIKSTLGVMGRSTDDIETACRVFFDASPSLALTEPMVPLTFREVTLPQVMKFGYYLTG